ncbi:MAG: hypothetical protein ACTTH7_00510 [Treponema sp.]
MKISKEADGISLLMKAILKWGMSLPAAKSWFGTPTSAMTSRSLYEKKRLIIFGLLVIATPVVQTLLSVTAKKLLLKKEKIHCTICRRM